jgi:peptide/nickel transport system substrate-binding protein
MRPFEYDANYKELYLGLDDPDMPPETKELWTYNPEKAKQLLSDAGYPNGFKTSVMITSTAVDSWSIYKDMWAKIGVDLEFDVRDGGSANAAMRSKSYEGMVPSSGNFASIWYSMPAYTGTGDTNRSMVSDPLIDETVAKARLAALTDGEVAAFTMLRELSKHIYWQVYDISPINSGRIRTTYWWPWIKNYSGEFYVGYFNNYWYKWAWIDTVLKKQMGY